MFGGLEKTDTVTILGETDFRDRHQIFGIKRSDRRYHMVLVGRTGMGKSTLMESMMISDSNAGEGFALLDPHGDLAEKVASSIPRSRREDLIFFNPTEPSGRLGLNILENAGNKQHLVVSGVVSVFKKIWDQYWGPRMEHIFRHTLWALVQAEGSTLADVPRLLLDKNFRAGIVRGITDPILREFWSHEFGRYASSYGSDSLSPILNKIGQFLSNPEVRGVVSQEKSSFDVRQIMDEGKILIANLPKGKLGEDGSALLGALLVTKFELAALSRAEQPPEKRRDFFLYVDEFPTIATESFSGLLSESRKYGLSLILAMQYVDQVEEKLRDALLENVGTLITFRIGPGSARYIAPQFSPVFEKEDLMNLGRYKIILRLLIDGQPSKPFTARTIMKAASNP
jgi:hypothetical protein